MPLKSHPKISKKLDNLLMELATLFGMQNYDRYFYLPKKDYDEEKTRAADIEIKEDYQRIYVNLYPNFFTASLPVQRSYLVHEFCHYLTHDVHYCADELLAGKLVTREQLRIATEKGTSRAANIIDMILLGNAKKEEKSYRAFTGSVQKK